MASEREVRIEEIFERALALPAAEREAFLADATRGDRALRQEIESLIEADGQVGGFLSCPAVQPWDLPRPPSPAVRERVGQYRILRRIGEGGMSEVFLAVRDDDEYSKRVALKIIRQDLDREDTLRRFRTERQILAGLDHPNIAKLLDGGTTPDHLPYFVMDYIDGSPIDQYCDQNRLTVRQRLELFRTVCSAVQYAHQNLIVHRDIKASNILVTAGGVPRLLDFGIAKLLKPDQFVEQVEYTQTWMRPMTPRYASPEQVQGKPVTTASDVYSLGVLLYKLLTDQLPYRLEGKPVTDLGRLVVEQDPERPSTSITHPEPDPSMASSAEVTPEQLSRARATQPQQLRRQLAGDLDNIVLMALRKEPQRRYPSVERLAEDIRCYLQGRPVAARGDTVPYRAGKFLRRNWAAVGVASAFVVLLAGFAFSMWVQASRVERERDQARLDRDRAEQVFALMKSIFEVQDPVQGGQNLTAGEILERGAARVERQLDGQPDVRAALMDSIGVVFGNLGLYAQSREMLEKALVAREQTLGDSHPDVAESLHNLGVLARMQGHHDEAHQLLVRALEIRRRQPEVGVALVETLNDLGIVFREQGDHAAAERLYREALAMESSLGEHPELATTRHNLGAVLLGLGKLDDAERLFRDALEMRRRLLGDKHVWVSQVMGALGTCLGMQGRYADAEPYLAGAVEVNREVLPPDHPEMAYSLNNLGRLRQSLGELDAAETNLREALVIQVRRLGDRHARVAHVQANLAGVLKQKGDLSEAERLFESALSIRAQTLGQEHAETAWSATELGSLLAARGRTAEAEPLLRQGLATMNQALGPEHPRALEARGLLGSCLSAQGRFEEAEPLLISSHRQIAGLWGPDHPMTRSARERLVELYRVSGRADVAERFR